MYIMYTSADTIYDIFYYYIGLREPLYIVSFESIILVSLIILFMSKDLELYYC